MESSQAYRNHHLVSQDYHFALCCIGLHIIGITKISFIKTISKCTYSSFLQKFNLRSPLFFVFSSHSHCNSMTRTSLFLLYVNVGSVGFFSFIDFANIEDPSNLFECSRLKESNTESAVPTVINYQETENIASGGCSGNSNVSRKKRRKKYPKISIRKLKTHPEYVPKVFSGKGNFYFDIIFSK